MLHLCVASVLGTLVINEVLYDPAGPDAGREFVEILNVSTQAVELAGVELEVGDGARPGIWKRAWLASAGELAAGELLVVGGDLVGARRFVLSASLQNGPDAVRLRRAGAVLDRVGYGALEDPDLFELRPALDVAGASLSRIPDGLDTDDNAADFRGADPTPGRRNVARRAWRVRLRAPDPTRLWPGRQLRVEVRVANVGLDDIEA
ncbi:MAG: lamin tail domain-containing protein, partial [Candidatus Krumholzibacteriia bacterium]